MSKFKVGDRVVGNAKAGLRYNLTCLGWKGRVLEVFDNGTFNAVGIDGSVFGTFHCLRDECFDLVEADPKVAEKVPFPLDQIEADSKVAEKVPFPLDQIEAGYLLAVRDDDGDEYYMTVLPSSWAGRPEMGCCSTEQPAWWPLKEFGPDLRYDDSEVIAVYGPTCCRNLLDNTPAARDLLWSRW